MTIILAKLDVNVLIQQRTLILACHRTSTEVKKKPVLEWETFIKVCR